MKKTWVLAVLAAVVAPAAFGETPQATGAAVDLKIVRVAGVGLRVSDLERSRKFYTEVLGLKVAAKVPAQGEPHEYLLGLTGNVREDTLIVIRKGEVKPGANEFGNVTLVVSNGRKMAERAVAAGYTTTRPIVDGTNFVRDPDGYVIELYQRPVRPAQGG